MRVKYARRNFSSGKVSEPEIGGVGRLVVQDWDGSKKSARPVSHSSEVSVRMAVRRRKTEDSLGNRPATRVRRLILRLMRSHMLEVRKRRRECSGSLKTVSPLMRLLSNKEASFGAGFWYFSTISLRRASAHGRSGESKTGRMSRAMHAGFLSLVFNPGTSERIATPSLVTDSQTAGNSASGIPASMPVTLAGWES